MKLDFTDITVKQVLHSCYDNENRDPPYEGYCSENERKIMNKLAEMGLITVLLPNNTKSLNHYAIRFTDKGRATFLENGKMLDCYCL